MSFYVEKGSVLNWFLKEFTIKIKGDELVMCCPFCEGNEKHWDYSFNIEKMVGKCWRGFSPECENAHNLLIFVSLYYGITFESAAEFIRNNFENKSALQRVKSRIKNFKFIKNESKISVDEVINLEIPYGSEKVCSPKTEGAKKALDWLLYTRKIPIDVIRFIDPYYIGENTEIRWRRHYDRVFFPIHTKENNAWLSYSLKKATKKNPKTLNPPGSVLSRMLYLYNNYAGSNKAIILCEGIFDALRMFLFGFNAVALFGTNISDYQINLLNETNTCETVVMLDADASELKKNKDGKLCSKAVKIAKQLIKYYIGDVSIISISKDDPDLLSYEDACRFFKNRIKADHLFSRKISVSYGKRQTTEGEM